MIDPKLLSICSFILEPGRGIKMKRKLCFIGISGLLILAFAAGSSWAVPIDLVGVTYPNLSAHVEFTYAGENYGNGYIYIDITNTSSVPTGEDPRLTAIAFNIPSGVIYANSMEPTGWQGIYSPDGINTPGQFGMFDLADSSGATFNGGSPNYGLAVGAGLFHFEIHLTGSDMTSLDEDDFLSLLSVGTNGQYFIARFQRVGPDGLGSDVAIPGTPSSVPEPATLLLLGVGLIGIAGIGRRKRT